MRFLVLGCNGMAGHMISLYLKEQGHLVIGYAREKSKFVKTVIGDVTNLGLVKSTILKGNYDSIVNCVGVLNQYADADPAQAIFINSYFPHYLVNIAKESYTQIIHMSTDCVFSGDKGGYKEDDLCDGRTMYDRSKALGEICNEKDITLRSSIVGPDIKKTGIGLLNWFMLQDKQVKGFTKSIWTGQTTLQLAKTIEIAALKKAHGLYNMVPDSCISKYQLLRLFNKYLRNDRLTIVPVDGFCVDKSLVRTRFDFNYYIPNYEIMIKELADWMLTHRELYPHYNM